MEQRRADDRTCLRTACDWVPDGGDGAALAPVDGGWDGLWLASAVQVEEPDWSQLSSLETSALNSQVSVPQPVKRKGQFIATRDAKWTIRARPRRQPTTVDVICRDKHH